MTIRGAHTELIASRLDEWLAAARRDGPAAPLLQKLWGEHRLQLRSDRVLDDLDELASRVGAGLVTRQASGCLVLPTTTPDRTPPILASALLACWWVGRSASGGGATERPVLYFGNTVGIREDLGQVTIRGLEVDLREVFGQTDQISGRAPRRPGRATQLRAGLPRLVTAFGPADPRGLVERHRPSWVCIDLTGDRRADWLPSLLEVCRRASVPFLAWTDNPGSSELEGLRGLLLALPPIRSDGDGSWEVVQTTINPLVLAEPRAGRVGNELRAAARHLVQAGRLAPSSRLVGDAVRAHWALLRTLESLPCPLDFYEANVGGHWGLHSVAMLQSTAASFRRAAEGPYSEAARALNLASTSLDAVVTAIAESGNPLWLTLAEVCIEGGGKGRDVAVLFPSRGRRALFSDALLSRCGASDHDLATIGVSVRTLSRATSIEVLPDRALLATPPHGADWSTLRGLLDRDSLDVVVYPSSGGRLERQIGDYIACWDTIGLAGLLGASTDGAGAPLPTWPPRLVVGIAQDAARGDLPDEPTFAVPGDGELDIDEELQRLVGHGPEVDEVRHGETGEDVTATVDAAIRVRYTDGWQAEYAPEQTVLRVTRVGLTAKVLETLARDLRIGDEVVAIHGQQRQDLYELLVARLHRNPAIELHLALLERWQQDLEAGYARWAGGGGTLEDLLWEMVERGSAITSTSGVRLWVTGDTLAPQDPEDVRRLAEILELEFVDSNYRRIGVAASRLRGLHRGLAHRLDNWLEGEAARPDTNDDPVIDEDAGIRFSDFRLSLLHLRVTAVATASGLFLRSRLGLLDRGDADD